MHDLLAAIHSLPKHAHAAAVLRHAARYPIVDATQPTLAEITPEGAATAERMGRQITGFGSVRIFHSPVKRCRQTAECLAAGLRASGTPVDHLGAETDLGVDYIVDLSEAGRLTNLHGERFVRMWIEGRIPETVVHTAQRLARVKLSYIAAKLAEPVAAGRRLDLHVTHDWNILVLRELSLGVRHEEQGWIPYLGGVAGTLSNNSLELVFRNYRQIHKLTAE